MAYHGSQSLRWSAEPSYLDKIAQKPEGDCERIKTAPCKCAGAAGCSDISQETKLFSTLMAALVLRSTVVVYLDPHRTWMLQIGIYLQHYFQHYLPRALHVPQATSSTTYSTPQRYLLPTCYLLRYPAYSLSIHRYLKYLHTAAGP